MKLAEALTVLREPARPEAEPFRLNLCTGFTPLHLQTFLAAHLRRALHGRVVEVTSGLFGDLPGNIESAATPSSCSAIAVILEWSDLDPRLGIRRLGGWSHRDTPDLIESCRRTLGRMLSGLRAAAATKPAVLAMPTLPMPMVGYTPTWEESPIRAELELALREFTVQLLDVPLLRVLSAQSLDMRSPLEQRFDVQSELNSGYPYKNTHADLVAESLAKLLAPPPPKKGLVTDLDNTLWAGILGEEGAGGVSWTLEQHSQEHGLYQQLLASLAETGVLVAVASKNEPANVEVALNRSDILLPKGNIFPVAAGWGAKSDAIKEILRAWNIGSDAVVFVDDSALELAEVKAAFPEIETLLFAHENPAAVWQLFSKLRDLFGKHQVSEEDSLRMRSLRNSADFSLAQGNLGSPEAFLESIEPVLEFSFRKDPADPRALELLNKTNQFNLNGHRFTEADWLSYLQSPDTFLLVVSYRDKFGPLGKIAVATGTVAAGEVTLDRWVMSCRAFSRRIEHATIRRTFEHFQAQEIVFDFVPTAKNGPLQQFFKDLTGDEPQPLYRLTHDRFDKRCPKLSHRLQEI